MEYPIKVRNVCITDTNRKNYKYIVVRECRNHRDEIEYWFYNFTNSVSRKPTALVVGGIETTLQIY